MRKKREFIQGAFYHVTSRTNNKIPAFENNLCRKIMFIILRDAKDKFRFRLANFRKKRYIYESETKEPDKRQRALREIGKVSINFGNLTFASLVLGTILRGDYDRLTLLLVGGGVAVIFTALGIVMLTVTGGEK